MECHAELQKILFLKNCHTNVFPCIKIVIQKISDTESCKKMILSVTQNIVWAVSLFDHYFALSARCLLDHDTANCFL